MHAKVAKVVASALIWGTLRRYGPVNALYGQELRMGLSILEM